MCRTHPMPEDSGKGCQLVRPVEGPEDAFSPGQTAAGLGREAGTWAFAECEILWKKEVLSRGKCMKSLFIFT